MMIESQGLPSFEIYFEIHLLHSDRWTIDSITTDRRDAFEQASLVADSGARSNAFRHIRGVRVVKEIYSPRLNNAAARIVFEWSPGSEALDDRRRVSKIR
ncbi:MAG: hypothetical protein KDG54_04150 [Geminicoccaceae bacterium]|nr:hypothetical protein [Geminicoccaceae bacterium]